MKRATHDLFLGFLENTPMSLTSTSASTFTQSTQFVALDSANIVGVNHKLLSAVVEPATSGPAGACITGPGTSITAPSIIFTSEGVPAGALLRGFSIGVMQANPGVITGVGVYDRVSHEYTNLYTLYKRNVSSGVDSKFADAFKTEVEQTLKDSASITGGTGAITLSAITNSKVLLRPIDSVVYAPLHPITTGGTVLSTGRTTDVTAVLAFAGYSAVPTSYSGTTTPGPFKAGGSFAVHATFDWYTAYDPQ